MTREEQKRLRDLEKSFALACRSVGKRRGWKRIAGTYYQTRDGMLYEVCFAQAPAGAGKRETVWLRGKPLALDELFWEVFHMKEDAAKMPFSFHVNGEFTAHVLTLDCWDVELLPEDLETSADRLFAEAEEKINAQSFPDIPAFREAAAKVRGQELNVVLCLLLEGRYQEAAQAIDGALARHDSGGFVRCTDSGSVSAMEDARDWCAARLAERIVT